MEFKVKGKIELEDLKTFYKEAGARSILFRLFYIFLLTFIFVTFLTFVADDIISRKINNVTITVLLFLYFLFAILRKINFPGAVKKIYDSDKDYELESEMVFTETQIEATDEHSHEIIKKEDIYFVVFGSSGIYIYKSRTKAELIPEHFFESEEQWKSFVDFAKQNYVPGPKKMRIYKPLKWWMRLLTVLAAVIIFGMYFFSILN